MSNTIVVLKGKSEISHELLKKTENKIFALDYNSHQINKINTIPINKNYPIDTRQQYLFNPE